MNKQQIIKLKNDLGVTWAEFAERVGVSHQSAKKWLLPGPNGRKPNRSAVVIMDKLKGSLEK